MNILEELKILPGLFLDSNDPHNFYRDRWACSSTASIILKYILSKDKIKLIKYVSSNVEDIHNELENNNFCYVYLENGDISIMNDVNEINNIFAHVFILYKYQGDVYRLESYIETYSFRITKWDNYKEDIQKLLIIEPGPERLKYWNNLFDCNELIDTTQKMYMEIKRKK